MCKLSQQEDEAGARTVSKYIAQLVSQCVANEKAAPWLVGGPFDGQQAWWSVFPGHQRMRLPLRERLSVLPAEPGPVYPEDCTPRVALYELEERWWLPLPVVAGVPLRRVYVYVFKGME